MRRTAALALSLFALVACGAPAEEAPAGTTGDLPDTAAVVQAVTKDDALAATLPEGIRQAGKLRVGSNVQNPPNNFYAADGTTAVGSEVDLAKAIGAKLGLTVEHQDMAFGSLITSLQAGRIDVTMAAMNDTAERQQAIDFVDYFTSGITIMVQKGNPQGVKGPDDLCGKAVAVNLGSSQETYAKEYQCLSGDPIQVTATDSDTQNQNQLRTGRVAAILNDLPTAVYVAKTAGDGEFFEVLDLAPINGGPYGIGVNKSTPELTAAIRKALQALVDDGTYGKILAAWDVEQGAIDQVTVNGR
ncbi:ABC transporter substrate-binding protein [Saccharothrix yanglingensis]|uniref:ABC transporter substrate-binding protein n=1 Tax=Saccharothrix yanglingensis TaxID=659496 RepID=A0ABU0WWL3_9PSEU|nr:ABC transporter substrate-binding protein [Saccharothrix yanglingensis]